MAKIQDTILQKQLEIEAWLDGLIPDQAEPLYSSVDLRDAGYKMAVVDTNLFPAGFNNLCSMSLGHAVKAFRKAVLARSPKCKNILIIAEEHTRNKWYLENVRVLEQIASQSGFSAKVATFLDIEPKECEEVGYVETKTIEGFPIRLHCLQQVLKRVKKGSLPTDLIILNNDLILGVPKILQDSKIPIFPSTEAGWHRRRKSLHFSQANRLIADFCKQLDMAGDIDPWFFSTIFGSLESANVNHQEDRSRLSDLASDLFKQIKEKYKLHGIKEKPFLFVKADAGTYGMGVLAIEDPSDILTLNRKQRNKLSVGKSSSQIHNFILQEGVPSIRVVGTDPGEMVLYQIGPAYVGSFLRTHSDRSARESLNVPGMTFKRVCSNVESDLVRAPIGKEYEFSKDCGIRVDSARLVLYQILGRIAAIAAYFEMEK